MHSKLYYYKCYSLKGIQHDLNRKKTLKEGMHVYMLEKAMASHSSTLAWKIPWMEEPGGLQSMGS